MSHDDIVIASTTDTPEQIEAALTHGLEDQTDDDTVLSEEPVGGDKSDADDKTPDAETKAANEKKADEAKPDGDAKKAAETAAGEKPDEKKKEPRPERSAFKTDEEWGDALVGWGARRRIGKLTAEKSAESQRATAAEAEAARLRKELEDAKKAPAKAAEEPAKVERAADKPKPQADQFDTHEAWLEALATHEAAVAVEAKSEADKKAADEAAEVEAQRERQQAFNARVKAAIDTRYPDYEAAMEAAQARGVQVNGETQYVLLTAPNGPDIAYYLSRPEHFEEAQALAKLNGPDAIRAVGRLEEKVDRWVAEQRQTAIADATSGDPADGESEKDPAAETKPVVPRTVTKAAAPIAPVGGGRSAGQRKQLHEIEDQREYNERRNAEEAARRKRR